MIFWPVSLIWLILMIYLSGSGAVFDWRQDGPFIGSCMALWLLTGFYLFGLW